MLMYGLQYRFYFQFIQILFLSIHPYRTQYMPITYCDNINDRVWYFFDVTDVRYINVSCVNSNLLLFPFLYCMYKICINDLYKVTKTNIIRLLCTAVHLITTS